MALKKIYDPDYDPTPGPGTPDDPYTPPAPSPSPGPPVPPGPSPAPAPGPGPTPGPGGGSVDFDSLLNLFLPRLGAFRGADRPTISQGGAPSFAPREFEIPTQEAALNEPGFAFRQAQGQQALENAAASRGILRTGGTLKDLIQYGQRFGAQEYANVFNRSLDVYDRYYRGAEEAYRGDLAAWQTRADAEKAKGLAAFQREFDVYNANLQAQLQRAELAQRLFEFLNPQEPSEEFPGPDAPPPPGEPPGPPRTPPLPAPPVPGPDDSFPTHSVPVYYEPDPAPFSKSYDYFY